MTVRAAQMKRPRPHCVVCGTDIQAGLRCMACRGAPHAALLMPMDELRAILARQVTSPIDEEILRRVRRALRK